jgi:hypothetical protein
MTLTSLKMTAAAAVVVGVAASGLGPVAASAPAQSAPTADYPPKIKKVTPKPSVSKNRKNVIIKVRPKVNRKFSIKVQVRKNGRWVQTRFIYRTSRQSQKVKIPVKPGRYRFRVLSRTAEKINTAFVGNTSKVVKVPKN